MTEERIQAVERVIAELETAYSGWTNKDVYEKVGGNYAQLAAYLKARRAGEPAGVVAVAEEAEPPTVGEQWQAARAAHVAASNRLSALQSLGQVQMLSEAEEVEQLRLERRMANLQPILTRLERECAYERARVDVETVVHVWGELVTQKQQAYQGFLTALAQLKQAYGTLVAVHRLQEQQVQTLPRVVQERLNFPDVASMERNLASRMTDSMGWSMVLGPPEPLALPDLAALLDVDSGTKALNPRMIQRFLEGG